MRFQVLELGSGLAKRGLYILPFRTERDEMMACAVTSGHRLTASGLVILRWGGNLDVAAELLARELEATDPASDQTRRGWLKVS